jgi:hypothetical protein
MEQGPLVGIFVTGPIGFLIGLLAGWMFERAKIGELAREGIFVVLVVGTAWGSLVLSRPGPQIFGTIEEGAIVKCETPMVRLPVALSMWGSTIAANPQLGVRPNWQGEARRTLEDAHGVVVEFVTERRRNVYRDPRSSALSAESWIVEEEKAEYFADFAGSACSGYPLHRSERLWAGLPKTPATDEIPPQDPAGVLGLEELDPIPRTVVALAR